MDIATIIGMVGGLLFIFISILGGGDVGAFINGGAVMIVVGGTVAATFINYSMEDMLTLPAVMQKAFFGKLPSLEGIIEKIVKIAEVARRDGILSVESELENIEDDFLKKGLQLVIDGTREESVTSILETELVNVEERHKVGIDMMLAMAGFAPAFGMIGTLIGLIQMLRALDDPSQIGVGMAVALITTFYGSFLANLVFVPIAGKLRRKSQQEIQIKELILAGIMGILNGENPRMINDTLLTYLKPKVRAKLAKKE